MDSAKYTLSVLVLFVYFISQTTAIGFPEIPYTPYDQYCNGLPKFATNGTTVALIGLENIVRSLRDHGNYDIIAMILERNLRFKAFPFCGKDFAFFVDRRNRITFLGSSNATVTLFVPSDDGIFFEEWADLGYQIAMGRIDEEAFESDEISEGSLFETAGFWMRRLRVDRVFENGTVSINEVNINEWNIYNDGRVIVHGTDGFFNHYLGDKEPVSKYFWGVFKEVKRNWMEIYEDPKTGSYVTEKTFMKAEDYRGIPKFYGDRELEIVPLSSIQVLI